jgi:uncharacterized protein
VLLVSTKLQASPIHGIGVFADQFIPAGTKVWELDRSFDVIILEQELRWLPQPAIDEVLLHGYKTEYTYILCSDNAKFMNHSENPNLSGNEGEFAARDIQRGEELLCNYYTFDLDAHWKLGT